MLNIKRAYPYKALGISLVALMLFLAGLTANAQQPAKYALLIGIDDYKADNISDLRGAVNDVVLMRTLLTGKFQLPPENVKVLTNSDATRAGIIDAIQTHLIDRAGPDDVVIVHYSGHGSQMPDTSGDEIDGYDETIVPHDSRTTLDDGRRVFDISDDEINGLLQRLTAKTKKVTFILDSCHSGSGSRAGNTVRQIAPDTEAPPQPSDYALSSARGAEGDTDIRLRGADYVLIAASLSKELANETTFQQQRHGALTYYLAQALLTAEETTTYQDVMDKVKDQVNRQFPSQTPQLEGPGGDLTVFGVERIGTEAYFLVTSANADQVEIDAGQVYGIHKGTTLNVYPPGTHDFTETATARIEITHAGAFSSKGLILEGGPVAGQSRAVLDTLALGDAAIPVFIESREPGAAGAEGLAAIRTTLTDSKALRLVNTETDARLIVRVQAGHFSISSGDLELISTPVPIDRENTVDTIVQRVEDQAHWLRVVELQNPNAQVAIDFQLRRFDETEPTAPLRDIAPGDYIAYTVTNRSDKALYITVLDVSSDGSISVLYPPVEGEQQALPAGSEFRDGDDANNKIRITLPDGRLSVIDTFKVIASEQPIDPKIFPRGAFRGGTRSAPAPGDLMSQFIADTVLGERGSEREVTIDNWTTAEQTVRVQRADTKLLAFAVHSDDPASLTASRDASGRAEVCLAQPGALDADCFELQTDDTDPTLVNAFPTGTRATRAEQPVTLAQAFEEAYRLQAATGAQRVEPMLDVRMPDGENSNGVTTRSILGATENHPDAENDDQWNHKQIRAVDAWTKLRSERGASAGAEADGVLIAHIDTGYRKHPEVWDIGPNGKRPIAPDKGYDYYDDDDDPEDPLLSDDLLDNPAHGTTSGSVIISPPGCQLTPSDSCVNGIAPGAQLAPFRVHRTVSQFNMGRMARIIRDIAERDDAGRPKLISLAMGGPPSYRLWKAVKKAEQNGVLIVAAAGNHVKTVVWPARFESTIAVAANDVHCQPWEGTSRGNAVDITAPGHSVWRAYVEGNPNNPENIIAMSSGTTLATGNTSGAAALWLAYHHNTPKLAELQADGQVTATFRAALAASAWRPGSTEQPAGAKCEPIAWDSGKYGPGILDVAKLLEYPLDPSAVTRRLEPEQLELFKGLFDDGTERAAILREYLRLFNRTSPAQLAEVAQFETELMHHYALNENVAQALDALAAGQGSPDAEWLAAQARRALLQQELSTQLRTALSQ